MKATTISLIALPERCYRCGWITRGIVGAWVPISGGRRVLREFDLIANALAEILDASDLREQCIGPIKLRSSRQRGQYLSNGCAHCDAILGSFPLLEGYHEYLFEGGRAEDLIVVVPVRRAVVA